jgi:long-chain acyl-CoA synthetase
MRQSVVSYLDDFARRGEETAFAYRRGLRTYRWSYARVASTAFQLARELETRGVAKGDRLLLCGENSAEWIAAFFGCLLRGAIVVPLDAQSEPDFVARVQREVGAKLLLHDGHDDRNPHLKLPEIRLEDLSATVQRHPTDPYNSVEVGEDDTVQIVFTSGTTAEPRGVCITHRNLLANLAPLESEIQRYLKWERMVHPVRFLCALPLSHVFGQFMGMFVPQLLGGEVFFTDSLKPSDIIKTLKYERISVLATVPRILDSLREKIEADYEAREELTRFRADLAASAGRHFLRRWWMFRPVHAKVGWKFWALVSGGAALSAETENFWHQLGFAVLQGYGMTETASLISVNHPFRMSRGSIGKELPGHEVKLADDGEILVRGASVTPGYWNKAPGAESSNGWWHTGDIGELDAQGNLYFKGRKKDVIVTAAGMNVYPEDIEAALNCQPEVRASAVIGVEGARGSEPLAVLILRDPVGTASGSDRVVTGKDADKSLAGMPALPELVAAIIERANKSLAEYQQIRRWFVWPEEDFPRTPTQKIRKQLIAERVKEQPSSHPQGPARPGDLVELIARAGGEAPATLNPGSNLSIDLNLDSLSRVELLSALEDRYQIEIDEDQFTRATTVAEVENLIHQRAAKQLTPNGPLVRNYPYPRHYHRFPFTWLRAALYYLVIWPFTRLLCPMTVRGREHLSHRRGPLLFVANHLTMVDHALVMAVLPARMRQRLAIAMEGELLRDWRHAPPGTPWFTKLRLLVRYSLVVMFFNVFPMPQNAGFRRSFSFAGEMMDRGHSILVFPEGRRSPDGGLHQFKAGTGMLIAGLDASVVPMRIDGLFELKQRGRHRARRGEVSISIGAPIRYSPDRTPEAIAADLQRRVTDL